MRLTRKAALLGAAFALTSVFTLAACSSDELGVVDLSGSYEVTGYLASAPILLKRRYSLPSVATRELTSTTYQIDIPGIASSQGNYEAFDNGTFNQNGTTTPAGQDPIDTQCTGTYTLVNSVLTIDTVCAGVRSVTRLEPLD